MYVDDNLIRCEWCGGNKLYVEYHDREWGVPLHDDQKLFELLTLEGAQAGLSWLTILKRRDGYHRAFNKFNIAKVSRFSQAKVDELIDNHQIIRNKLKILSVIKNAKAILDIQGKFGSFDNYLWQYVDNKPMISESSGPGLIEAKDIAVLISKDLRRRGMNFVGPTICYAFMQASGMVNDHSLNCFRNKQLAV